MQGLKLWATSVQKATRRFHLLSYKHKMQPQIYKNKSNGVPKKQTKLIILLYEAMQDESTELCFIFRSAHSVLYFPLENIVPEILLRIRCNKLVKVPLTLVHYGKYCTRVWSRGKYSTRYRLVLY